MYQRESDFEINRVYRHWKGKYYFVEGLVTNTETRESMVLYTALYGDKLRCVRPYSMFTEKVPEGRDEDNITGQIYRFEPFDL